MSEDRDYSSHLSVLRPLLASQRPRKVLEFGAGMYSTPCFLQRPELERIVSVEPNDEWRRRVAIGCNDERLVLRRDKRVIPSTFDLVLIDDGECAEDRLETIRLVLRGHYPVTVIHDADVPEYATAIEELAINAAYYSTFPDTAVVWS